MLDAIIATFLFLLFFGYLRSIVLNIPIDSKQILYVTILFGLWYSITFSIVDML